MRSMKHSLLVAAILITLAGFANAQQNKLVTANYAGVVRLGMTVKQVRKAIGRMTLVREAISDGVPALTVKDGSRSVMAITGDDITKDSSVDKWKINENAKIDYIQVYDKSFRTAAGVKPGMLISEAEKKYGKVKEITISEIEQQEYATFARGPKGISFRVSGNGSYAGTYLKGRKKTARYRRTAVISHIDLAK